MGIDKPHVRFVIHFSMPKSLVNFYQESGRAGRDGLSSDCVILYSYVDKLRLERMILSENPNVNSKERQIQQQMQNLNRMVQFCENEIDCRRSLVLEYFGEVFDRNKCQATCDNCLGTSMYELQTIDVTFVVKEIISCLSSTNRNITFTESSLIKQVMDGRVISTSNLTKDHYLRVLHRLVCDGYILEIEKMNRAGFPTVYLFLNNSIPPYDFSKKMEIFIRNRKKKKVATMLMEEEAKTVNSSSSSSKKKKKNQKKQEVVKLILEEEEEEVETTKKMQHNRGEEEEEEEEDDPVEEEDNNPFVSFRAAAASPKKPKLFDNSDGRLTADQQKQLLELLKECTKKLMTDHKVSRHWSVWTEKNLMEMCARVPLTTDELSDITEVSEEKVKQFGMKTIGTIYNFLMNQVPEFDLCGFKWKNKRMKTD